MNPSLRNYVGSSLDLWTIEYRVHATQRMFNRRIAEKDVFLVLEEGKIIEEYREDFPFPSVLINGKCKDRPLHAVVAIDADSRRLYLITIYEPDFKKWSQNFSKRILP